MLYFTFLVSVKLLKNVYEIFSVHCQVVLKVVAFKPVLPLTTVGSVLKATLDSFMWGSYARSFLKNIAMRGTWVKHDLYCVGAM
jgi:hypothetical protein